MRLDRSNLNAGTMWRARGGERTSSRYEYHDVEAGPVVCESGKTARRRRGIIGGDLGWERRQSEGRASEHLRRSVPEEFCSLLPSSTGWLSTKRKSNCSQIMLGYENGRAMVVYTAVIRVRGGGNIARYGGIPDQIYRARAGLPLRTVYLECSQVHTHLSYTVASTQRVEI